MRTSRVTTFFKDDHKCLQDMEKWPNRSAASEFWSASVQECVSVQQTSFLCNKRQFLCDERHFCATSGVCVLHSICPETEFQSRG